MPEIVLASLNAAYIHSAFGLRCLAANLGRLSEQAEILEFAGKRRAVDMAEEILRRQPSILGLGVYVWNAAASLELVSILRRVAPRLQIVLGGPEVSHELEAQPIVELADFVVTGEGEIAFAQLCERLLE